MAGEVWKVDGGGEEEGRGGDEGKEEEESWGGVLTFESLMGVGDAEKIILHGVLGFDLGTGCIGMGFARGVWDVDV